MTARRTLDPFHAWMDERADRAFAARAERAHLLANPGLARSIGRSQRNVAMLRRRRHGRPKGRP